MLTEEEAKVMEARVTKIRLPRGLDEMLAREISQKLDKAGIYFHVFRRVKDIRSIIHKMDIKVINPGNPIQDYVGLKFVFYFVDDMKIAEKLIDDLFGKGEWSKTEKSADGFSATKRNGVYRIPEGYLTEEQKELMADCLIDTTFEVQLKTMLFQSWHEIEHDFRYKHRELWELDPLKDMDRKLNRVLATLELCDDSLIGVFDKMAYRAYRATRESGEVSRESEPGLLDTAEGDRDTADLPEEEEKKGKPFSSANYNLLHLERIAQNHFRIRMRESLPPDRTGDGEDIENQPGYGLDTMREHFNRGFRSMIPGDEERKERVERVTGIFSSPQFLKKVIKYKRSDLIRRFLDYPNDVPINIFNICAIIFSDVTTPEDGEEAQELRLLLRRYLRMQFIKKERRPYIPVKRYKQYATYQCYSDIYPVRDEDSGEVFRKVLHELLDWMTGRIGPDELTDNEAVQRIRDYVRKTKEEGFRLEPEVFISDTEELDIRFLYMEQEKTCVIRIIEPDNRYEDLQTDYRSAMLADGRMFITDISLCQEETHVEMAVRILCRESASNMNPANSMRPAFVRQFAQAVDQFRIVEHGCSVNHAWIFEEIWKKDENEGVRQIGQVGDHDEWMEFIGSTHLPVVLLPDVVMQSDFEKKGMANTLVGYGHVLMDPELSGNGIRIIYPPEGPDRERREETVEPEMIDGTLTYVYTWNKVRNAVQKNIMGKDISFGKCKFYRELKNDYYKAKDGETAEHLKERIENLEREIRELKAEKN